MYLIKKIKNHYSLILSMCMCLVLFPSSPYANDVASTDDIKLENLLNDYKDVYRNYNDGPGVELNRDTSKSSVAPKYIYEKPTFKAVSHLYWALNFHKIGNTEAVDQYMMINECDLYKKFGGDEIEWRDIREATKTFLKNNKDQFPTRFEFVIPLKLGDYDKKRKAFAVAEEYAISSSRRFESYVQDVQTIPCYADFSKENIYPISLILEYSRPLRITHIPMSEEDANQYIKNKRAIMMRDYKPLAHSAALLKRLRNAYIVMKVKFFTFGKVIESRYAGSRTIQLMGVLEGYEIYEDINMQRLIHSENYVSYKKSEKLDVKLKDQYDLILKKSKGRGVLH